MSKYFDVSECFTTDIFDVDSELNMKGRSFNVNQISDDEFSLEFGYGTAGPKKIKLNLTQLLDIEKYCKVIRSERPDWFSNREMFVKGEKL